MDIDTTSTLGGRVAVLDGAWLAARQDWRRLADVALLTGSSQRATAVLLDVRGTAFNPIGLEADLLAAALGGYGTVAIVSDPGASYGHARRVAVTVELHGSLAAAFHDHAQAWRWLRGRVVDEGPGSRVAR